MRGWREDTIAGVPCSPHAASSTERTSGTSEIPFLIIRGADEEAAGEVTVRDMATGEQHRVPDGDAGAQIERLLDH
ncbi:His/Gly/Thr/Pro-type tRNA ligase C-terminal domain-containing protein [Streptomonospora alba]